VFKQVLLTLTLGLSLSVIAADLSIGVLRLTLGADKAAVMRDAGSRYKVLTVSNNSDEFFLVDAQNNGVILGRVVFSGGKLVEVTRKWGSFDSTASNTDIGKALFGAIESAAANTDARAVVRTRVNRVPGAEWKSVFLEFPGRTITVTTTDADAASGGKSVDIDESIFRK
jgi:hypothetical protein